MVKIKNCPAVIPNPRLQEPILRALSERRLEISAIAKVTPKVTPKVTKGGVASADLLEESLRRLCVSFLPKLRRAVATAEQVTQALSDANQLSLGVTKQDYRPIDALNLLFESWPPEHHPAAREIFLSAYAYGLDRILDKE